MLTGAATLTADEGETGTVAFDLDGLTGSVDVDICR